MKSVTLWLLAGVSGLALLFWFLTRPVLLSAGDLPDHEPDRAKGEQVFYTGGCASCHGSDLGGGLEMNSDFGTFRVPNISPDPVSGSGNWTTLEFVNAMMRGVSPDGTHYYPAFPYTSYTRMDIRDVIDLKAYIDSLPPVSHKPAPHELNFPWNLRRGIGLWKKRYFKQDTLVFENSDDPSLERGRYLVEGAGHCAECHTPRDDFGGLLPSYWLAGGPNPDGDGTVPNITPDAEGLKAWSESDIAYYLESGFTPDFDTVGGAMVKVQENLAHLPDTDRVAIAAYLKALPARPDPGD
jgi:mono/diheme cytochrome c family protein